jgi:miniconductance mechanosensitive channel
VIDWLEAHPVLGQLIGLAVLLAVSALSYFLARRLIVGTIRGFAARSAVHWDNALVDHQVFGRLSHVVPALVTFYGVELIPGAGEDLEGVVRRVSVAVMIFATIHAGVAALSALNSVYSLDPENRSRPIKGYVQLASIGLYLVAALLVIASLMDRSPLLFLSGIGAMTAVLLLIFRDTILGLVASVQLTTNDMVHVGDWIEMPQCGADGDVIDVALHTVKVQNWDKTITTIPTYKLIEGSFKNWRGMSRSGGRRIKRAISVDVNSIRFLTGDEIERYSSWSSLRDYMQRKRDELAAFNAGRDADASADLRQLTNVGTLRAYIESYLRQHPKVHQGLTLIVRQLAPSGEGLPIEIYCFTNDTDWAAYEGIQADIFDHILAVAPEFDLRLYQNPTGRDLSEFARTRPPALDG